MNAARKLLAIAAMTIALLGVSPAAGAIAAEQHSTIDRTAAVTVHADNSDDTGSNQYTKIQPQTSIPVSNQCNVDATKCLPYNRWNGASTALHGRFDGFGQVLSTSFAQRNQVASLLMGFGNGVFMMAAGLVDLADQMKIVEAFGRFADEATATFGRALLDSPIIMGIAVVGVGGILFGLRRGIPPWKRLTSILMVFGVMTVLVNGAIQTTNMSSGFGIGSPGWLANGTNQTVHTLLDGTTKAMLNANIGGASSVTAYGDCAVYVKNLETEAAASKHPASATQIALNAAWMQGGLQAFKYAQYGTEQIVTPKSATANGETFGDEVYCRQLEMAAAIPASQQMALFTDKIPSGWAKDAAAWGNTSSNNDLDQTLVGLAACMYDPSTQSFVVRPGFLDEDNGKGIHQGDDDCVRLYNTKDDTSDKFDFGSNSADITSAYNKDHDGNYNPQPAAAAASYLNALHGSLDTTGGTTALAMWSLSSVLYAGVLIVIAIVTIFAKFVCVALVFAVVFAAVGWMIRRDGTDAMAKYGKMYVSFAVVAASASLILTFVVMLANVLQTAGNGIFGPGSPVALLWAGLCPAIAAVMLHYIFKKVIKMPSPMSPSGALGWATAASGGAIGGMIGNQLVDRFQNRAAGALKSGGKAAASGAGRTALRAATGGRLGNKATGTGPSRLGKMAPKGAIAAGAGAGAGAAGAIGAGKVKGQLPAGAHDITEPQRKSWSEKMAGASSAAIKWSENEDGYRKQVRDRAIQALRDKAKGIGERVVSAKESITTSTQATASVLKNPVSSFKAAAITPEFWDKAASRTRTAAKVAGMGAVGAFTGGAGLAAVGMAGAGVHSAAKAGVESKRRREEERAAFAGELAAVTAEKEKAVLDAERALEKARAEIGRTKGDEKKRPEAVKNYNEAVKLRDKASNNLDAAQAAANYFNSNKRVPARPQGPSRPPGS